MSAGRPAKATLETVGRLAADLRETELATAQARARFEQAVRRVDGATQQELADAAGLSRQRIAQILNRAKR